MMTATPQMVEQGRQLFATSCARCHGTNGVNGQFGPNLADDEWLWINPSSPTVMADVANLIRTGVSTPRAPGSTGMPPMGGASFTDDQLNALAAYVLSL
jgi:mono/diheme cytochrome c family protein